jgi:hypothetical protein
MPFDLQGEIVWQTLWRDGSREAYCKTMSDRRSLTTDGSPAGGGLARRLVGAAGWRSCAWNACRSLWTCPMCTGDR